MCIRIPYNSQSGNQDEVVDVSEGTLRKLIYPQGQSGNESSLVQSRVRVV